MEKTVSSVSRAGKTTRSQRAVLPVPEAAPPRLLPPPLRFLLSSPSRRTPGSQIPPLPQLSAGPPFFVEVTWWLRTQKGARSSPTRSEAGTGCGRGGAAQPWGASLGRSRRTRAEKLQWAVWGVGVFFLPGPIAAPSCASARLSPSPPRPGAGVTVSGDFLCAAVGHAPSLRGPTGETQACVP